MLVDEIILNLKAGDGGKGVVRWLHEKGKDLSGPAGGDGGAGGDVYAQAVRDVNRLAHYTGSKDMAANHGGDGESRSKHGANGGDLIIDVPVGSIIKNQRTGEVWQLLKDQEKVKLLSGGRGGLGNEHFKGSTNRSPKQSTPGKVGEEGEFFIELQLAADVGLIGLPNAGKSSLLNMLTAARSKVGDYPFTTLEPNLGELYGYILADIPGLIEGASEGKGLGHKFLRHIKRTRALVHCISLENEDLLATYEIIRKELGQYSTELIQKPELVFLTKADMVDGDVRAKAIERFKNLGKEVVEVSILDNALLKAAQDTLFAFLKRHS